MSVISTDPSKVSTEQPASHPMLLRILRLMFVGAVALMIVANILMLPQCYQLIYDHLSGAFASPLLSLVFSNFSEAQVDPTDYGLSLDFFTTFYMVPIFLESLALLVGATYIFYRRSTDRVAVLNGVQGAILGVVFSPATVVLLTQPVGEPLIRFGNGVFSALTFLFLFIFPDGRVVPRWAQWLLPFGVILSFITGSTFGTGVLSYVGPMLSMIGFPAQIHRYANVSTPAQRQQTKWILFGLLIVIVFFPTMVFSRPFFVQLGGAYFIFFQLVIFPVLWFGMWLVILAAGAFSVLRYNLWQVDLVINRGVVYIALTAVLVALFFGIIVLLQTILERLLGSQQTTLATIGATAAVAALFNPTRVRLRNFVDRRVFRLRADLNEVAAAQKKPEVKNPGMYTGRTFGSYEILGVLGKGGMGEVYKGFGDGQTVAIKVLPSDLAAKENFRKRFDREAQTLAALQHPNIVTLYTVGVTDDDVHYLAMEYIDGQELSDVIENGALQDDDALRDWLRDLASALDYIHAKGLVHRDLKPSNIMLRQSPDGETHEAVLMDFGIARVDATGTRLTGSGAVGTIDYMAPEQILAAREVDKRADVYALGIIVYELLTGERPFKGSAGQILFAHLQQPPPDPRNLRSDLSKHRARAILRALEKEPDERFQSAGEFADALAVEAIV